MGVSLTLGATYSLFDELYVFPYLFTEIGQRPGIPHLNGLHTVRHAKEDKTNVLKYKTKCL